MSNRSCLTPLPPCPDQPTFIHQATSDNDTKAHLSDIVGFEERVLGGTASAAFQTYGTIQLGADLTRVA
jgi:hypothetical protein